MSKVIYDAPSKGVENTTVTALSWAISGGLLLGGVAVALMSFLSKTPGYTILLLSSVLFIIGSILGYLHGSVLGIFGRDKSISIKSSIGGLFHGILYLIPSLLVGWMLAGWISALPITLGRSIIASIISISSWVIMSVVLYIAVTFGWKALTNAYSTWKDRLLGTLFTVGILFALLLQFYLSDHEIWFTGQHLTNVGKLLFVLVVTFWVYGPLVTIGMHVLHNRLDSPLAIWPNYKSIVMKNVVFDTTHALMIGTVLAFLMVPFYHGSLELPSNISTYGIQTTIVLALVDAFSNELFLRLFLFTIVFWISKKKFKGSLTPMWIAIGMAAVADGLIHSHDYLKYGIPTISMLISYVIVHIVIPSIAFGYLYWRRGLGTAMATHAVSGIMLALLTMF